MRKFWDGIYASEKGTVHQADENRDLRCLAYRNS